MGTFARQMAVTSTIYDCSSGANFLPLGSARAIQAVRDLSVHENILRKWMVEFGSDPAQAFPVMAKCGGGDDVRHEIKYSTELRKVLVNLTTTVAGCLSNRFDIKYTLFQACHEFQNIGKAKISTLQATKYATQEP
jgi:hypothetical protein